MLFRAVLAVLIFTPIAFAQNTPTPFEGTHWTLTELNGVAVTPSGPRAAYLEFADGNKVSGSTGCNRLTGSYDRSGSSLKLHPVATTMMACVGQAMDLENKLKPALGKVTRYRMNGDNLTFYARKRVLARLKAEPANQSGSEN